MLINRNQYTKEDIPGLDAILKSIKLGDGSVIHNSFLDEQSEDALERFLYHPVRADRFNYLAN